LNDLVVDGFAGPGGWSVACRRLGLTEVGIELDAAACATRAAAGHATIRADITRFDVSRLAGHVTGMIFSPECQTFSTAGGRAGVAVLAELTGLIGDLFAGKPTRAAHRNAMARALRAAGWPPLRTRPARYNRACKTPVRLTRGQRAAAIRKAVLSAALVAEPARFITAARPGWVALEQVPDVLPLWRAYAAELRRAGYSTWTGILNAADYGVPQTRRRAILIASRTRQVHPPAPTHYDPRKGMQLWGTPWISMAEALGWGATGRPVPAVTAGGTAAGGAEPFGHRDRDMLAAEQTAGRWALRTSFGQPGGDGGTHLMDPAGRPAHVVTTKARDWILHTNRDQRPDGTRQTTDPAATPAPAFTGNAGGQWKLRNNNNNNACERSLDEPAGTLFFGHRANEVAWTRTHPATTVCGRDSIGRPGHKDWAPGGESQFARDSVRITVAEAAVLQSFPPGYPWQGSKTAQFTQVGNAIPPLLAIAVIGAAAGISWEPAAAAYSQSVYDTAGRAA
jgi:DNA (cytosine-5)-methyltransferase 1